jgi:hypothetical protein
VEYAPTSFVGISVSGNGAPVFGELDWSSFVIFEADILDVTEGRLVLLRFSPSFNAEAGGSEISSSSV